MESRESASFDVLLTTEDLEELLHLSKSAVRRLLRRGEIPPVRINARVLRYRLSDLQAFLARCSATGMKVV